MAALTRRIQVLLSPYQALRLQTIAESRGESVGSLIRKAIDHVYFERDREARLEAVREIAAMGLPVADWEQMKRESVPWPSDERE